MDEKPATTEPENTSSYVLAQEDGMTQPTPAETTPVVAADTAPSKDILVATLTATRFIAAGAIISAGANMHSMNPSTHYMIAGILLFASQVAEFLEKSLCSCVYTFAASVIGSLLIVIIGAISIERADIEIDTIGIVWIVAALILTITYSCDIYKTYGKTNIILDASKIFAIIGSLFFTMAGIIMYSLDNVVEENIHNFADMFVYGGICYIVHAVTLACGHEVILDRVIAKEGEKVEYTSPVIA